MIKKLFKESNNKIILLLILFFITHLVYSIFIDRNIYYLIIGKEENNKSINIYTRSKDETFSENKNYILKNINNDHHLYGRINSTQETDELRIDIDGEKAILKIYNINFKIGPYERITLDRKDILKLTRNEIVSEISKINVNQYREIIELKSDGKDPYFIINTSDLRIDYFDTIIKSIIWTSITFFIIFFIYSIFTTKVFITKSVLLLCVGFMSILILSKISPNKANPDEIYGHLPNCFHYTINSELPDLQKNYLIYLTEYPWGLVRSLNFNNLYYFLNGKFVTHPIIQLIFEFNYSYRLLNIILFGSMLYLAAYNKKKRLFFIPLLFSSQVLYTSSYINDDFFSLSLCIYIAYIMILKNESKNNLQNKFRYSLFFLVLATVFSKLNFYLSILGIFSYYLFKNIALIRDNLKSNLKKYSLIIFLITSLIVMKLVFHYDSVDKEYLKQEFAHSEFRNSSMNNEIIYKRLGEIFSNHYFLNLFKSAFGNFGMMNIFIDQPVEKWNVVGLLQTNFFYILILFCITLLMFNDTYLFVKNRKSVFIMTFYIFFIFNVLLCLFYSFFNDIQYQGRYLFPIIPIYCIIFYESRNICTSFFSRIPIFIMISCTFYFIYFFALQRLIDYS